jgi:hypothetical protein
VMVGPGGRPFRLQVCSQSLPISWFFSQRRIFIFSFGGGWINIWGGAAACFGGAWWQLPEGPRKKFNNPPPRKIRAWVFFTSFKDGLLKAACKNVRVVPNFRLSVYYPSENIKAWICIVVTFRIMFNNFLFPLRSKGYR